MRVFRFVVPLIMMAISAMACGQVASKPVESSDAQKAFNLIKSLAGTWQGSITTDNPAWATDKPLPLSIRVASHGNALVHELNTGGPEVTVFYVENDRLTLMHYCDFGNRPHMIAQSSTDGKTLEFDLADFLGSNEIGHVSQGIFTIIDVNHHTEDWIFMPKGSKPVHAHIDFKRV